ncbi:unnamed protein product, partial [Oncorhynchus mykiss]
LGEVWRSAKDVCVERQCVLVGEREVFITHSNVSCPSVDPTSCPLGSELRCDTTDCCPRCHCAPQDACVLNHTVIGAEESLMVDLCTHCTCSVEEGAVRRYKLSCRRISCPTCPEVTHLHHHLTCLWQFIVAVCNVASRVMERIWLPLSGAMPLQVNVKSNPGAVCSSTARTC